MKVPHLHAGREMDEALDRGVGEVLLRALDKVTLNDGAFISHQDLLPVDQGDVTDNALGLTQDGEHLGNLGHPPEAQATASSSSSVVSSSS